MEVANILRCFEYLCHQAVLNSSFVLCQLLVYQTINKPQLVRRILKSKLMICFWFEFIRYFRMISNLYWWHCILATDIIDCCYCFFFFEYLTDLCLDCTHIRELFSSSFLLCRNNDNEMEINDSFSVQRSWKWNYLCVCCLEQTK